MINDDCKVMDYSGGNLWLNIQEVLNSGRLFPELLCFSCMNGECWTPEFFPAHLSPRSLGHRGRPFTLMLGGTDSGAAALLWLGAAPLPRIHGVLRPCPCGHPSGRLRLAQRWCLWVRPQGSPRPDHRARGPWCGCDTCKART